LTAVLDVKRAFEDIVIDDGGHMNGHILEITARGIRSKFCPSQEWNKHLGRAVDHYQRFVPAGTRLPVVPLAPSQILEATHLNEIKKIVTAAGLAGTPFWTSVLAGGVGSAPNVEPFDLQTLSPHIVAPIAERQNVVAQNVDGGNGDEAEGADAIAVLDIDERPEQAADNAERRTEKVTKHKKSTVHEESYQFEAYFVNQRKPEWLELDDLVDPDCTVNEHLTYYLAVHPQIRTKGVVLLYFVPQNQNVE
jgi:hypothetical protein